MDDLSRRSTREVLRDHLIVANDWVGEPFERIGQTIHYTVETK